MTRCAGGILIRNKFDSLAWFRCTRCFWQGQLRKIIAYRRWSSFLPLSNPCSHLPRSWYQLKVSEKVFRINAKKGTPYLAHVSCRTTLSLFINTWVMPQIQRLVRFCCAVVPKHPQDSNPMAYKFQYRACVLLEKLSLFINTWVMPQIQRLVRFCCAVPKHPQDSNPMAYKFQHRACVLLHKNNT